MLAQKIRRKSKDLYFGFFYVKFESFYCWKNLDPWNKISINFLWENWKKWAENGLGNCIKVFQTEKIQVL